MAQQYDLVIRNGLIVDGRGGEPRRGDVAVKGDRIVAVGTVAGEGAREIDAKGKLVTPGFVDVHTHYDGQAVWSQRLNPSSSHGVTTVVMGNCGVGFAPCRPNDHNLLIRVMEGVEDIPGAVMAEGLPWTWETFPEYLDAVDARPRDIDVAAYLPHSPLRVYVMGDRGANREAATPDDLARMRVIAREAVEAGALGFASSRTMFHKTADGDAIPTYDAAAAELRAIGDGLADAGAGIIQLVPNNPGPDGWGNEVGPLIELGRATGRPVTFTLGTGNVGPQLWQTAIDLMDKAKADGVAIKAQVFPRPIGLVLGYNLSANPFCLCPSYKAIAALPLAERVAKLRDPAFKARILAEQPEAGHPLVAMARSFDWMFPLEEKPDYEPPASASVSAQAQAKGVTPEEFAYDYLLGDDGHAMFYVALGNFPEGSLDQIGELLTNDNVVIGLGDGGAHYGMICDASYPTFLLSHWVRDRKSGRIDIAEAVKALTHDPATLVGLEDRGVIAPGYKADLNVIDLEGMKLHAPRVIYDLPAGGRRLDQVADGYDITIVSGSVISEKGQPTGALPGKLVRGRQQPAKEAA